MNFYLHELVDISQSPFSISYRGVRRWAASFSNRKDFMSSTRFKVALTDVKEDLLHLSMEELSSFSSGSLSSLSLSAGILFCSSRYSSPALDFPSLWLCYHTFLHRCHMQQNHQKITTTDHYDLGSLQQGHLKPHFWKHFFTVEERTSRIAVSIQCTASKTDTHCDKFFASSSFSILANTDCRSRFR